MTQPGGRPRSANARATAIVAMATGVLACSSDPETTNRDAAIDARADAPGTPEHTYDYAVSAYLIEGAQTPPRRGASGFNLDARVTGNVPNDLLDCDKPDFFSAYDPDQHEDACIPGQPNGGNTCRGGVDNQLPALTETIVGTRSGTDPVGQLRERTQRGQLVVLVRVAGVNGVPGPTLNDDHVTVTFYLRARPMNGACFVAGQPGQRYQIDPESLTADGSAPRYRFEGAIVAGRLRVADTNYARPGLVFAIPLDDTVSVPFALYGFQFRASLGVMGATDGNLGGFVRYREFADTLVDTPGVVAPGIDRQTVAGILAGFIDIATDAQNRPGVGRCFDQGLGGIGIGMAVTLTTANVDPTVGQGGPVIDCDAGTSPADAAVDVTNPG